MIDLEQIRDCVKVADRARRENYACKVCGAIPDSDGSREHGRGCYTQNEEGGGTDYVEVPPDLLLFVLPELLDFVEAGRNLLARIHRDGGHYQDEHGIEQAFAHADARVVALMGLFTEASNFAKIANLPFGDYTDEYRRAKASVIAAVYRVDDVEKVS